jgi:hypothetical protein
MASEHTWDVKTDGRPLIRATVSLFTVEAGRGGSFVRIGVESVVEFWAEVVGGAGGWMLAEDAAIGGEGT